MSKPLSTKNRVVVASAGSRKTTLVVETAVKLTARRVLITTYTNENLDQIRDFITARCGCIPVHITLLSWFSFLLQDGIRPYQACVTSDNRRVNSILFEELADWNRYTPKKNADKYYLTAANNIYRDRVSEFVCSCEEISGGLVLNRLQKVYNDIFIDEVQDLAGYDLNILERLFHSSISVTAVGDPRQGTFSTNNSGKNKQYKKSAVIEWFAQHAKSGLIVMEEKNDCYRCNQQICDFADKLFPEYGKTKSMNTKVTGHDGVFQIKAADVGKYVADHNPTVLRWNKSANTLQLPAINIGAAKGRTYERVLIFPTKPMKEYLVSFNIDKAGDRNKLYVAVTRAKYSVAFVV